MTAKPDVLALRPDGVPSYLADQPRWVLWRLEPAFEDGKLIRWTKPPISLLTSKKCDVTQPTAWASFTSVVKALSVSKAWDGGGIVLGANEQGEVLIGLDLDQCLDENGDALPWAMDFLTALGSYAEYSPGGNGVKCYARLPMDLLSEVQRLLELSEKGPQARTRSFGDKTEDMAHAPGAQLFFAGRYFTVTGHHWAPSPEEVALIGRRQIERLAFLFGPNTDKARAASRPDPGRNDDDTTPEDAALREKLQHAFVRNPAFKARWEGGREGLGDTSRSGFDMSVVGFLKAAGFAKGETRAALMLFEHGKLPEMGADAARQFARMWENSAARAAPPEPEPPADFEERHPPITEDPAEPAKRGRGRKSNTSDDYQPPTSWPEPIDLFTTLDQAPPDVINDEMPAALWPFVKDTAERMGVARSSVTLCAVVSCSAVIDNHWRVQPKANDYTWIEPALAWGALVGDPSMLKTPIVMACTTPIDRLEIEGEARWKEDVRDYDTRLAEWQAVKDNPDPKPTKPLRPRYIVESTTIEALQEVLRGDDEARFTAPANKVLMRQDELSEWLANMDRYSSGGRGGGDRGGHLRLWNGNRHSVDRVGRGAFTAPSWAACPLGGIQPEPIQQIAKQSADDGLLQRFLFDVPSPYQSEGVDRTPNRTALDRYRKLFPALVALHPAARNDDDGFHEVVRLHTDAQQHRHNVERLARATATMPDTTRKLRSALGKWPGYFARLCLIFHLIEVADARANNQVGPSLLVISADTAARVERYMRNILLPHLIRAYALMFATVQTGHAKWIAGHILAHGLDRVTARDIVRAYVALAAPEAHAELDNVMASLVVAAWLDPETPRNPLNPVSAWQVNPAVHLRFKDRADCEREDRQRRAQGVVEGRQATTVAKAQRRESP
jgi:hypothetical protein